MSGREPKTDNYDPGEEIVAFLTQYTQLLEIHLASVRKTMADTVVSLMEKVEDINRKAEEKKKLAGGVLVKRQEGGVAESIVKREIQGDDDAFKNTSVKVVEEQEKELNQAISLESSREYARKILTRAGSEAGNRLREHMAEFGVLGENIGDILMSILGNLSADDVVGQRLTHVGHAIKMLNQKLDELFENVDNLSTAEVLDIKQNLLELMYKNFTMEEERAVYQSIVGDGG
jgi:hypothetical protein